MLNAIIVKQRPTSLGHHMEELQAIKLVPPSAFTTEYVMIPIMASSILILDVHASIIWANPWPSFWSCLSPYFETILSQLVSALAYQCNWTGFCILIIQTELPYSCSCSAQGSHNSTLFWSHCCVPHSQRHLSCLLFSFRDLYAVIS